jgi:hypothetical protein
VHGSAQCARLTFAQVGELRFGPLVCNDADPVRFDSSRDGRFARFVTAHQYLALYHLGDQDLAEQRVEQIQPIDQCESDQRARVAQDVPGLESLASPDDLEAEQALGSLDATLQVAHDVQGRKFELQIDQRFGHRR